jgi:hypothetical protein
MGGRFALVVGHYVGANTVGLSLRQRVRVEPGLIHISRARNVYGLEVWSPYEFLQIGLKLAQFAECLLGSCYRI